MIQNVDIGSMKQFNKGLNTQKNLFDVSLGQSPACIDVDFNEDGSLNKRLGTSTMNTTVLESTAGYGMFDFKINITPQARRLICSAGTGIYYSTNVGRTFSIIHTSRAAVLNHFSLIDNYVVNTNRNYQTPLYWAGSTGVNFSTIADVVPLCKYSIYHQGYFILLNETNNPLSMYYVIKDSMFNGPYSTFKFLTEKNDEIIGAFILNNILFISTKYKIFRLTYNSGGNPDWIYSEVRNFGFTPLSFKKILIPNVGEVIIGLDWDKKIRIFNGSTDEIISTHIQRNNTLTPFYLDNINIDYIDTSWAEDDKQAQLYRLYVPYGTSPTITHCLVYDYRIGAFYPYQTQAYQSGILAEGTARDLHMLACDYNGRIHQVDSGNTDAGTAINEYYFSPLLYNQTPTRVSKFQQVDLYFSVSSSGTLYFEDRNQFSNVWSLRKTFTLGSAISSTIIRQSIDIPENMNVYQFKVSSSANKADSWQLNIVDYTHTVAGVGVP